MCVYVKVVTQINKPFFKQCSLFFFVSSFCFLGFLDSSLPTLVCRCVPEAATFVASKMEPIIVKGNA